MSPSEKVNPKELPELPKPSMTQLLTQAVPQPKQASDDSDQAGGAATAAELQPEQPSLPARASTWVRGLSQRSRWILGSSLALVLLILVVVLASGGSDEPTTPSATPSAAKVAEVPADWFRSQLGTWRDAGLEPGGFADVDPGSLGASECQSGAVAALEVTLCEFSSAAAASRAIAPTERSLQEYTAVVASERQRLLIVADRRSADPSGKTINKLVQTFAR